VPEIDISRVSAERGISQKQLWLLANLTVYLLGYEWPENRREASMLISELSG
jgi:hypothetical protein